MALDQSSISVSNELGQDAPVSRQSPDLCRSVWGDFFLAYDAMETFPEEETRELERLREDIKMTLKRTSDGSSLKLRLIDNIQRLGVSYQFKDDIETSLTNIKNSYHDSLHEETHDDLHTAALRFRLLRQQGYPVSSEALKTFQKREGEFEASLVNDAEGLLSLYEASHYRVEGEKILEQALAFTTASLEGGANNCSEYIARKINQALNWPIHKTMNRVTARGYISLYKQDESRDEVLLKFAVLDFNRLQRLYQKELCALTKWWENIDTPRNFPFVRDRFVENYFLMMAMYIEPQYSLGRKILAKVLSVLTIIDDIFDTYGTIDDLRRFTDATERWNVDADDQLPPYMKLCYQILLEFYTEMEQDLAEHGRSERFQYAKEEMINWVKSSYEEAYWSHTNYIPTLEEIKDVGVRLTTTSLLLTTALLGLGDLVTKEVLDWMTSHPLAVGAISTITQFIDDVHDFEDTEHSTAVDCYMNEHGVSSQKAIAELHNQMSHAWKVLNKGCLLPSEMPLPIMDLIHDYGRHAIVMFKYGYDGYTHSGTDIKQLITSIFVDPIAL